MATTQHTAPSSEPVSREELKPSHLHVTYSDDDLYIDALIKAARRAVEVQTGRSLITQKWRLSLDCFPDCRAICLEKPPIQGVDSITYVDLNGATQTLSPTKYTVDTRSAPGRVVLNYGEIWPTTGYVPNAVEIVYSAGYGDTGKAVDDDLKQALAFLVSHWFKNHEPVESVSMSDVPKTFDWLIGPHKVYL